MDDQPCLLSIMNIAICRHTNHMTIHLLMENDGLTKNLLVKTINS